MHQGLLLNNRGLKTAFGVNLEEFLVIIKQGTMDLSSSLGSTMSKAWLQGPLALSKESSRFELPMDVGRLNNMPVLEYLKNFCVICSRRKQLYRQSFLRADKDRDGFLTLNELKDTLTNVIYVQSDAKTCVEELLQIINENEMLDKNEGQGELKFDLHCFRGVAALLERMLCRKTDHQTGGDGMKWSQYDKRNTLEQTDFDGLKWKLKGCGDINGKLLSVFGYL